MASYAQARALFDDIVRLARLDGKLRDAEPFSDSVDVAVTPFRTGQLAIDDVGEPGEPRYRLLFMVTVDVYSGPARRSPPPLDLTEVTAEQGFSRILDLALTDT